KSGNVSSVTYGPPPIESRDDIKTKRETSNGALRKSPRPSMYRTTSASFECLSRASVTCGENFRGSGANPIRWQILSSSACRALSSALGVTPAQTECGFFDPNRPTELSDNWKDGRS